MSGRRPELLSPAGDIEKFRAAVRYGADAVYISGRQFGMRSACDNFTRDEMAEAVELAHGADRRVYVTVNIMPRTEQYGELARFVAEIADLGVDAVIVSDLGVFELIRDRAPSLEIHI